MKIEAGWEGRVRTFKKIKIILGCKEKKEF